MTLKNRATWGCPRTKNRSNWCYAFCTPKNGLGECGRPAAHALLGRTQRAILRELESKQPDETESRLVTAE